MTTLFWELVNIGILGGIIYLIVKVIINSKKLKKIENTIEELREKKN